MSTPVRGAVETEGWWKWAARQHAKGLLLSSLGPAPVRLLWRKVLSATKNGGGKRDWSRIFELGGPSESLAPTAFVTGLIRHTLKVSSTELPNVQAAGLFFLLCPKDSLAVPINGFLAFLRDSCVPTTAERVEWPRSAALVPPLAFAPKERQIQSSSLATGAPLESPPADVASLGVIAEEQEEDIVSSAGLSDAPEDVEMRESISPSAKEVSFPRTPHGLRDGMELLRDLSSRPDGISVVHAALEGVARTLVEKGQLSSVLDSLRDGRELLEALSNHADGIAVLRTALSAIANQQLKCSEGAALAAGSSSVEAPSSHKRVISPNHVDLLELPASRHFVPQEPESDDVLATSLRARFEQRRGDEKVRVRGSYRGAEQDGDPDPASDLMEACWRGEGVDTIEALMWRDHAAQCHLAHVQNNGVCADFAPVGARQLVRVNWFGSPLHYAAVAGRAQAALVLLSGVPCEACATVLGRPDAATPSGHRVPVVDLGAPNSYGSTPLHKAAAVGSAEVTAILLQHATSGMSPAYAGSDRDTAAARQRTGAVDVAAVNWRGDTPLHNAARGGHVAVIELLLGHRAPLLVCNKVPK